MTVEGGVLGLGEAEAVSGGLIAMLWAMPVHGGYSEY